MNRFPPNDIISLVDAAPRYDLAESLGPDLRLGELLDPHALSALADLPLAYGSAAGDLALREQIARAHDVQAGDVVVTVGGVHALYLLALVLCGPGAEAVAASPLFPPARDALLAMGGPVRTLPLRFEDGYQPDLAVLDRLLSPGTRLVSLASPQNPSGVAIAPAALREIAARMARRAPEAFLLVDETYRDAPPGDAPPAASALALGPRVVVTGSLSKCHGAPGLRIGWAVTRDAALREQLVRAKFNTVIACSRIDEALALRLLRRAEADLPARRAQLAAGLARVARWAGEERRRVDWIRPDAGALCCVRLKPEVFDDAAVARFHAALPGLELRVGDGRWFGEPPRVFRLGFGLLAPPALDEALRRLSTALDRA
jgi:aspartate/methionine/tyrosine aminotransferase